MHEEYNHTKNNVYIRISVHRYYALLVAIANIKDKKNNLSNYTIHNNVKPNKLFLLITDEYPVYIILLFLG